MGILFHVNKILKYKVEIPSIAGQSEGQDLGAYSSVLLLQKRMAHTSHCAALSWGYSAPSREKGLVPCAESVPTPACQGMRLPWVTLTPSWTAGTPRLWALQGLSTQSVPRHTCMVGTPGKGLSAQVTMHPAALGSTQRAPILLGQTPG